MGRAFKARNFSLMAAAAAALMGRCGLSCRPSSSRNHSGRPSRSLNVYLLKPSSVRSVNDFSPDAICWARVIASAVMMSISGIVRMKLSNAGSDVLTKSTVLARLVFPLIFGVFGTLDDFKCVLIIFAVRF